MSDYRKLLKEIQEIKEETTSADIASVDTKLGSGPFRRMKKGKKCKEHKRFNCDECQSDDDEKWS